MSFGPDRFKSLIENTEPHGAQIPIKWRSQIEHLRVYRIPISDEGVMTLRWNHRNGRIRDQIRERCSKMGVNLEDYFMQDFTQSSLQKTLESILKNESQRKVALKQFKDGLKPDYNKALLVTHEGRIINGNQRYCIFKELVESDPDQFEDLSFVYVAVLPEDGREKDYRRLEIRAQENELPGAQFDWIQKGLTRRDEVEDKMFTVSEIAAYAGETESEITRSIAMIELVDLYLTYIGKEGLYHGEIRKKKLLQAFKEVENGINKLENLISTDNELLVKEFTDDAWNLMSTPGASDGTGKGIYTLIRKRADSYRIVAKKVPKPKTRKRGSTGLKRLKQKGAGSKVSEGDQKDSSEEVVREIPIASIPKLSEGDDASKIGRAINDEYKVLTDQDEANKEAEYAANTLPKIKTMLTNIQKNWGKYDVVKIHDMIDDVATLVQCLVTLSGEARD